ncbi:MAG TPA: phosphate/phosphite/phosphonate ABC transporter substrate-binding protein [Azospirillum sp.]|nr:phosphate/phosphite/phosphonate ABC transporter substrate-binding protein [Azospirillum sp.]
MTQARTRLFAATVIASAYAFAAPAQAQTQDCPNRGELDQLYCDRNGDLVADAPTDPKDWKDPDTLVFTYTPVEDPAVYANIFKPFQEELGKCTGKKVVYFQVQSNAAEIEAMRSGRLHVAGFSTGPTGFAVNLAGAVPFAVKGGESGFQGYQLWMLVKADSPYKTLADLKGKKIAHTSPSSNSGNLAPRALFPELGLVPEKDYQVLYSGKHDQSVMGVVSGDYDAAPVASDVYTRMVHRGQVDGNKIRVIYKSETFPTSSFAHAHSLKPELAQKLVQCFTAYRFPDEMKKAFEGADRFVPVTYKDAWAVVRKVADGSGTPFNAATYAKQKQ